MANNRKPRQPLNIPATLSNDLTVVLRNFREVMYKHQELIGTGDGDDKPVKANDLRELVRQYTGLNETLPAPPQVRLLNTETVRGGRARLSFAGNSYAYKGHSHIEVWRANRDQRREQAEYLGRTDSGVFTDATGEPRTVYRYFGRNVNLDGVKGPWSSNDGTEIETGGISVEDIDDMDGYLDDEVVPMLAATVDAKKSWVGANVNDWNAYFEGNAANFPLGLQLKLDDENDELFVRFKSFNAGGDPQTIRFEIEAIGTEITGFVNYTLEGAEVPADKAGDIDFREDTGNQYGPNGVIIRGGWEVTADEADECKFTLSELTEATIFRLKVLEVDSEFGYFISLGDMMADRNALLPIEYWLTAADGSSYDVLRMKNAHLINQAIADAAAAQSTADGKIQSYYQDSAPDGMGESEGDIWFDTSDGNTVYIHDGTDWALAQDSDIAAALDAASSAQATADGKVTTFYASSEPTAEGLGDLWYNTVDGTLSRWDGSDWNHVSDVTAANIGNAGNVLLINPSFESGNIGWSFQDASIVNDPTNARNGDWVLKLDIADAYGHGINDVKIPVDEGDRILAQCYFKGGSAGTGQARVVFKDENNVQVAQSGAGSAVVSGKTNFTRARNLVEVPSGAAYAQVRPDVFDGDGGPCGVWYCDDVSAAIFPKDADIDVLEATNGGLITQALADAAAAQSTADGKIQSWYQGAPPSGDGESEGDFWIDTNDGNTLYVYESGEWVESTDTRLPQAITDAANAQATADGKVTTFYASSAPTAEAVGDLWYDTDNNSLYRWSGADWLAVSDITSAHMATSGINLMPHRYCIFSEADGLPDLTLSGGAEVERVDWVPGREIPPRFGDYCLQLRNSSPGSNAFFSFRGSDANIPVQEGSYLWSLYANRAYTWTNGNVRFRVLGDDGGSFTQLQDVTLSVAQTTGEWPRYAIPFAVPSGISAVYVQIMMPASSTDSDWSSLYVDGFMVSPLIGDNEDPPPFAMPSADSAIDMSDGPLDPGAEKTEGAGSSVFVDDDGWSLAAEWTEISNLPDTLAGYGITDGQEDLGPAMSSGQVLHRDSGGDPYWADKFGTEFNGGFVNVLTANTVIGSDWGDIGTVAVIDNPGREVTVVCEGSANYFSNGTDDRADCRMAISMDGGSTWTTADQYGTTRLTTANYSFPTGNSRLRVKGTPTGDIHIKMQARQRHGSNTVRMQAWTSGYSFILLPRSSYAEAAGALSVTVPTTRTGSCSKALDKGTTCTAGANVTAEPTGGVPGYSYDWDKVSGSHSITSGATSKTCTVSGTETTDDPADTYNTTVKCTVTDSDSSTADSGNCVVTLSFLRTFNPLSVSVPNREGTGRVIEGTAIVTVDMTRSVSGGNGDYTSNSWEKVSGSGTITSGATSESCTVSTTMAGPGQTDGDFRCTVEDSDSNSDSDVGTATFYAY